MTDELLTVPELANRWRVSSGTVHNLLRRGEFPNAWRAGTKRFRIPKSDIEAYEEKTRVGNQGKA